MAECRNAPSLDPLMGETSDHLSFLHGEVCDKKGGKRLEGERFALSLACSRWLYHMPHSDFSGDKNRGMSFWFYSRGIEEVDLE